MDIIANLFQRIEMKLDDIEELVDDLEDNGQPIDGIREAIAKLWDEIHNVA